MMDMERSRESVTGIQKPVVIKIRVKGGGKVTNLKQDLGEDLL
jgi:hypothetical protein